MSVEKKKLCVGFAAGLLLVLGGLCGVAGELDLAWDAPATNVDGTTLTDLAGFKVYQGTAAGDYSAVQVLGNVTTCRLTGLVEGTTYYFAVTAVDGRSAESDYSAEFVWTAPDTTPPSISVAASVALTADANGVAAVPDLVKSATVTDNCSPASAITLVQSPAAGTSIGCGVTTVGLTATDAAGNSAQVAVQVTVTAPPPVVVLPLPAPWSSQDIGTGLATGSVAVATGVFSVAGAGSLGGTADKCRYLYQALSGDGEIKARVRELQGGGTGARTGVMIRESLTPGSRQVTLAVRPDGQLEFLRRTSTAGAAKATVSAGNAAPNNWVRLVRRGTKVTAYKSADGVTWTSIGTQSITMASTISIGLATVSGTAETLATGVMDTVTVVP